MDNTRINPFETGAAEYDAWYTENAELYRSELDAIKALFPEEGNNIEIGVGTGVFASKLGIKTGVEPAEEMAKIATLDKNKRYYNGTPEQIAGYKAWAPDFDAQE